MRSDNRSLLVLLIATTCLISGVKAVCSTQGCSTCNFQLSGSAYSQVCSQCITGYKLNPNGTCDFDLGLILGLSLGAVTIIIIQIIGFCLCQLYFKNKFRKPVQYTLQQIFEELEDQKYHPSAVQEINQKYKEFMFPQLDQGCPQKDCRYCSFYELKYKNRKQWPKFHDYEKWKEMKEQRRKKKQQSNEELAQEDHQEYKEVNPKGPTVKIDSCKHYYHLPCLKKQVKHQIHIDKENRDPNQKHDNAPSCICNQDISQLVITLICKVCKAKERRLKFRLKQKGVQGLREYTCAFCYDKIYKQVENSKWINKIVK